MEIAAIFFSSLLVGFSGALMPGPVLTVTIAHAVRRGRVAGPLVALGHGAVEVALVGALTLGLSTLLQLPLVTGLIGVLGGLCLFYMGTGMIRTPAPAGLAGGKPSLEGGMGPVAAGAITSVANPLWVLWWATVGAAQLLLAFKFGIAGIAAFYLGHLTADFSWFTAVGMAVSAGRKLFTPRVYRSIFVVCGSFLLLLGLYFLASGADSLSHL